jgi:hypothetical protein
MRRSAKASRQTTISPSVGPEPPAGRPHKSTQDVRARFASLTAKQPVNEAVRSAFVQGKIVLAHTHPALDVATRDLAVKNIADRLGVSVQHAFGELIAEAGSGPPVPGGVGYGVFYAPSFKTAWEGGTSLVFDIVCPTPPGGTINTWLFLTATNRSAMGVEALIAYNGQNDTHFLVFDWARSDHWQTDIPLSGLANYLGKESAHGRLYQVLPVWNSTWQLTQTNYRNQVLLYNGKRGGWDLVYQYDYAASDSQQKTGWVGSWAPIVETFQTLYANTNPLGALRIQISAGDTTEIGVRGLCLLRQTHRFASTTWAFN